MNEASDLASSKLRNGVSISHYRIESLIGAGGMGEVYRAHDSQLDRPVALKILPADLVRDADRARRFVQEAKTASSLNHPHIITIFEIGREMVGTRDIEYIVMELIDGRTLREAIHGEKVPLRKLTELLSQAADALAKAHASGIVHRDLKPDNIMVTRDGFVKVLDFGLAKLTEAAVQGLSMTHARTLDRTRDGVVLGTPSYMSPEQAQGKPVDHRTDIFSLGSILYEAATRKKAFEGDSDFTVMEKIVHEDPPQAIEVNPKTPPQLSHVIRRCLAKDPDERYQSMKDLAIELRDISHEFDSLSLSAGTPVPPPAILRKRAWIVFTAIVALALGVSALFLLRHRSPVVRAVQSSITPPEGWSFESGTMAMSPDGTRAAFTCSNGEGKDLLWIRRLDGSGAQFLDGTDGAGFPFWSPDSSKIGFFDGPKLKIVEASGGVVKTLCDAPEARGGAWNRDGVILFQVPSDAIYRVSEQGGVATAVVKGDRAGAVVGWPSFLPDGDHFLYFSKGTRLDKDYVVYVVSLNSHEQHFLLRAQSRAVYVAPGYILFSRGDTLVAQAFDAASLRLTGPPVPIAQHVQRGAVTMEFFSASDNGILIYEGERTATSQLIWLDRTGKELERATPIGNYSDPLLSHDNKSVLLEIPDENGNNHIWRFDLTRRISTRLTFGPGDNNYPIWSPDDQRIVFTSTRRNSHDLFMKNANGSGTEELLTKTMYFKYASAWSSDGHFISFSSYSPSTRWDVFALSLPDRKTIPIVQGSFNESSGHFSPDDRWVVYQSDETGRSEIYVQPFPPDGRRWQITTDGGHMPAWSADGKELFFTTDQKLMSIGVQTRAISEAGAAKWSFQTDVTPKPLFKLTGSSFSPSRDGQRFLLNVPTETEKIAPVTLVQNWPALLRH